MPTDLEKAQERVQKLNEKLLQARSDYETSIREQEEALDLARLDAEEQRINAEIDALKEATKQVKSKAAQKAMAEQVRDGQFAAVPSVAPTGTSDEEEK